MTGVEYMCSPFARCGVNVQTTARSMLRYNIVTERETADALLRADAYLSTQPTQSENEKGQMRDIHADDGAAKSLTDQRGVGSSGRIRTEKQPSTPADPDPLDPDPKAT
jgi:hypothetical protein